MCIINTLSPQPHRHKSSQQHINFHHHEIITSQYVANQHGNHKQQHQTTTSNNANNISNINKIITNWLKPIVAFGIKTHRHKHHHFIFALSISSKLNHRKTHHLYSSHSYHEIIKSYSFHVHHKDHHQIRHHISSKFNIINQLKTQRQTTQI